MTQLHLRSYKCVGAIIVALAANALGARPAAAMPPGADGEALRGSASALAALRVEDASTTVTRLAARYPTDTDVRFERALVRFYQGDYPGAVTDLDAAGTRPGLRSAEDRASLAALIRATNATTRGYLTVRSPDGRYVVRHAPGPDAVLVPYALEAMAAADRALSADLGVRLPGPIRLEIYPTAASLAEVSTLTVAEIATTGTIALCKWDRLMVTSPRALIRGYPWMDTIGHELVHLVLSRASADRAPVWFQEGVAKFLERRWRGEAPRAHLDPASEALLGRAVRENQLLPFDRLHPSIARLPSQEHAALAFAQVATFIEQYHRTYGGDRLRAAIQRMAAGDDAREALAAEAGVGFAALEGRWRTALASRPAPSGEAPALLELRLQDGEAPPDDAAQIEQGAARRHLRLGDLLWDRGRSLAASVEYGRAHALAPDEPVIAGRYGRAALAGGRPEEAVRALAPFRERYPDYAPTWAISGSAYLAMGDLEQARAAVREAIRLNPFDPQPHCDLADASDRDDERARERGFCTDLGGRRTR